MVHEIALEGSSDRLVGESEELHAPATEILNISKSPMFIHWISS
jgi:hypothetical protein